jgi:asparagine synthase (glutamine-hydrolysing)
MCGIAGIVSLRPGLPPIAIDDLGRMTRALAHRGPDEFGVYRDDTAGLAHARLSIIDLATGQQPLANESESLWISFNGEIFNYVELRDDLEKRGHRFRTRSDTEVIVHAYEEWGDDAFRRFNGQWAVALWDSDRQRLVLARDPFGVRPLFVCVHDGRLYFASEVKAIFAANPSIPRAFEPRGLAQVFTFWTSLAPVTVFKGVEEIRPGAVRTYEDGRVHDTASYTPAFPEHGKGDFTGSLDDAVGAVRAALEHATRLRMLRADVPVGSYLSGGLDSSLVSALALRAKGQAFQTFSLRFTDAEYDETEFQHAMARHLGTDHHEVLVSRADIARVFPNVVMHAERPILRTAPAPLYLLSRLVHESGIKVVLTGEGADEMFAGYDLFREAKVRRFWGRQPASKWRPSLLGRLYPYLQRSPVSQQAIAQMFFGQNLAAMSEPGFGHDMRWRSTSALKRLFDPGVTDAVGTDVVSELLTSLPDAFHRWSPLAQDQYLEVRTLMSGYLLSAQGDRMLMAHSVEGRFPFLDRNVAALAESLPDSYKLRVLDEKHVLKRAAADLVPAEVRNRKKQPYRAPDALALATPEADSWIEEVASPQALKDAGVFRVGAARQLIAKCRRLAEGGQFSNTDNMALVGMLSTQLLHEGFIRRVPAGNAATSSIRTVVDRIAVRTNPCTSENVRLQT